MSNLMRYRVDALIFGSFCLLYFATSSLNLTVAHDSVHYLANIISGSPNLHPHHLLYEPLSFLWVKVSSLATSEYSVQVSSLNSFFGAGLVLVVFKILRQRLCVSGANSLLGAALLGVSFGVWFYSVTVEVYIIPAFLLASAAYVLLLEKITIRDMVVVGVLHGLAMLFHQVHFLFGFVALARLFFAGGGFKVRAGLLSSYAVVASSIVLLGYFLAVAYLEIDSKEAFYRWFFGYANNGQYWHDPFLISTYVKAVIGFARAFVGGQFLFAIPAFQDLLGQNFSGQNLVDEFFLVRNLGVWEACLLFFVFVTIPFVIVLSGVFCLMQARQARGTDIAGANVLYPLIVWFGVYALFFLFWEPHNPEFWITQVVCFVLIYCWFLERRITINKARYVLMVLVSLVGVVNFFGTILPCKDRENDFYTVVVDGFVNKYDPSETVAVIGDWWPLEYFLKLRGINRVVSSVREFDEGVTMHDAIDQLLIDDDNIIEIVFFAGLSDKVSGKSDVWQQRYRAYLDEFFDVYRDRLTHENGYVVIRR